MTVKRKILHHRNIGHSTTACGTRGLANWRCTYKQKSATCSRCRSVLGLIPGQRKGPKKAARELPLPVGFPVQSLPPDASDLYASGGDFIDRAQFAAYVQGVRDELKEWERVSISCVSPGETLIAGNALAAAVRLLLTKL